MFFFFVISLNYSAVSLKTRPKCGQIQKKFRDIFPPEEYDWFSSDFYSFKKCSKISPNLTFGNLHTPLIFIELNFNWIHFIKKNQFEFIFPLNFQSERSENSEYFRKNSAFFLNYPKFIFFGISLNYSTVSLKTLPKCGQIQKKLSHFLCQGNMIDFFWFLFLQEVFQELTESHLWKCTCTFDIY